MASIAFLNDAASFTGETLRTAPLGGVATTVVELAEALARRGHEVVVFGVNPEARDYEGVAYRPLAEAGARSFDLAVAVSTPKFFRPGLARSHALWMHNPAGYMRKPRHFLPYFRYRPAVVFLGDYHRKSWLKRLPLFRSLIIPHGVGEVFLKTPVADAPPPPRAIFYSNPRRGLAWLSRLWAERIWPEVPGAELRVYASHVTYGVAKDDEIAEALTVARSHADRGVMVREPLPKAELAARLATSRLMLYRGDAGETFCLAAAEAAALGVPVVTAGLGSLAERVRDGVNGIVAPTDPAFAAAAVGLLKDDAPWRRLHDGALASRRTAGWDRAAETWEAAFLR